MKILEKNKLFYEFSADLKPAYYVDSDEIFLLKTDDCYCGQIKDESILRPDIDISIMDASVGPIYVNNSVNGDALEIEILKINLADKGVMVTSPGLGVLGEFIKTPNTKILKIENNSIIFNDKIKLPIKPMIGVIGVAPESGSIHCAKPGSHGGNLDTKEIKEGSKVYLPVFHSGALVGISDLHATMGDGELSGTGLEIAGEVILKIKILKDFDLKDPVVVTNDSIFFLYTSKSYEDSIRNSVKIATDFLSDRLNLTFADAYRLISATSDIRISQVVNGVITTKTRVPRYLLSWEGFA